MLQNLHFDLTVYEFLCTVLIPTPIISIDKSLTLKQAYLNCCCLGWDHFFLPKCGYFHEPEPNQSNLQVLWAWMTRHKDSASKIGSPSRQNAHPCLRAQEQIGRTHMHEGRLWFMWD